MRGIASAAYRGKLPARLTERLALLERGGYPTGTHASTSRRRLVRAYFGLGLAGGCILGCLALLVLLFFHPERVRTDGALTMPGAKALVASVEPSDRTRHAGAKIQPVPAVDLVIRNSDRARAPFPLYVTGADSPEGVSVMLRDLPASARFSRGARKDEHTWALRLVDLDDLHVTLSEGTPDAFNVSIEVATAAGTQLARSVARVRLLDAPPIPLASEAAPRRTATRIEDLLSEPGGGQARRQAPTAAAASLRTDATSPSRTEVAGRVPLPRGANAPAKPVVDAGGAVKILQLRPQRPEGVSALGGPGQESGRQAEQIGRKLWWKMPQPAWAPFQEGAARQ